MDVINTTSEMRRWSTAHRSQLRVFVPTMGALHEGHVSLVRLARNHGDRVVVSIFVNPTQFGPGEDFASYPRELDNDLQKLAAEHVDVVFVPTPSEIFPPGTATQIDPGPIANVLCGAFRPGHFRGVATVVTLLVGITETQALVLGEKDYQQLQVIRSVVRDLRLGIEVIAAPIARDLDGLALSSRNRYLSPEQRVVALALPEVLSATQKRVAAGHRRVDELKSWAVKAIEGGGVRLDYFEIVDTESLEGKTMVDERSIAVVAGHVSTTRLIDNQRLKAQER